MSCTLLSSGVWCLLVRLPVIHLVQGPASILVVLTGYMVVAGAITFPASCLLYREHNVTEPHRPLLPENYCDDKGCLTRFLEESKDSFGKRNLFEIRFEYRLFSDAEIELYR
ncbi:hypothetical protein K0M31_014460 [Melipona bicolor]|uniref:Uncharacterized protein n=1 Tax=Melipona bicolor TaxID=60889 RepID=A0AA40G8L1_9HYME|nr:hypothetical protein K0M31_014460 [Melipona bicolor]